MPVENGTGLREAAWKVRARCGERAHEVDRARALDGDVIEAVREAGFARHFVASRWGGSEGTFGELTDAVVTVGGGCAATAWCASLAAYSSRFATHLPADGHSILWSTGPDTMVATGVIPSGDARATDGGWRLTGQWGYVSGIDFADWVLLCAPIRSADDGGAPRVRFFALPHGAWTVRPTWDNVGMRATGSHTVIVDDEFVPYCLSFDRADMFAGRNGASDIPSHNVPFQAVGGLTFAAPIVGAAYGLLSAAATTMTDSRRSPRLETKLVRASARVDSAHLLVAQNAEVIDERRFTPELMARNERNAAFAAEILVEATELLVAAGGTSGLSEAQPLQRFWRDIISATSHVALQYDTAARKNYSAILLGPAPA